MSRRLQAGLIALALLCAACHPERSEGPGRAGAPQSPQWETLPSRDAYAGSESCRDCHEKNFDHWSHDWHSRALSEASPATVVGNFRNAHFQGESSEASMSKTGDTFVMRTRDREGKPHDYPVSWVIGGKRMQDAVTVFDDGRWQVLPVYYHVTGHGAWVDYNEAKQGKVTPDHPWFWTNFKRTANKECLECHATGVDVRYDAATHHWSTTFADAGVACEACHGPGARHAETKAKSDILRADHLDKERELSVCARCHGPREPLFPLLDTKDQFRPGERYDDRYQALVVVDSTERSGEFFADGRPSSSSFEYQALVQSRCYLRGGATCLSCHNAPHDDHGPNEVKSACGGCHQMPAEHSHHRKATCTDCHMPRVLSGVLDKFPDHALDIPNLDVTARHGVPNACGVCHADKSVSALAAAAARWWPDYTSRTARRSRLADAIDEKTAASSADPLAAVVRDTSEAPILRGACAALLGQRFPRFAAEVLPPLLNDRSPVVRAKFIEALGYAQARGAADAIAPLTRDQSLQVRELAALVLASFDDPRGLAACASLPKELVRPHIALGIAAAKRNDLPRARAEMEAVVKEAPYATDALVMLADIAARRSDLKTARAYLEEALRFDPSHRGALGRLQAMR